MQQDKEGSIPKASAVSADSTKSKIWGGGRAGGEDYCPEGHGTSITESNAKIKIILPKNKSISRNGENILSS